MPSASMRVCGPRSSRGVDRRKPASSGGALMSSFDDEDNLFADTRMSFWDHIEVLRTHMWRAIVGFLVALIVGLIVGKPMVRFIARPVEEALGHFYHDRIQKLKEERNEGSSQTAQANVPQDIEFTLRPDQLQKLGQALGVKEEALPADLQPITLTFNYKPLDMVLSADEALRITIRPPTLSTLSATEAFVVYLKVSMYCGIVLASPWIFYQLWSFVAAGLYPHEKKLVHLYLPFSIGLFLAGIALSEFVVLPVTLRYLIGFNTWMDLEPDLRLNEWLTFAILFPLMFGIAFQLPLVMYALHRVGIVDVSVYRKHRRMAYFLIACSYVIIGMSPDAFSMLSLVVPLWALYELGIFLCRFAPESSNDFDIDSPEPGEMVEV
jgi:sec-independent protein translocase protein TatC